MECNSFLKYKADPDKYKEYKNSLSKSVVVGAYSFNIDCPKEDHLNTWYEKNKSNLSHTSMSINDNTLTFCFESTFKLAIRNDENGQLCIEANSPYNHLVEEYEKINECLRNEFKDCVHKTDDLSVCVIYNDKIYCLNEDSKLTLEE